jgi:GT2 family glycosyltransferase
MFIGLACAIFPYSPAASVSDEDTFFRSARTSIARGHFVGKSAPADVTALIVTYNSRSHIGLLIEDLRVAAHESAIRVVVVDNQSADGTADIVGAHRDIELIESGENLGYAGGINLGLPRIGPCDAVFIVNPDVALVPGTVTRLHTAADGVSIGAVVPLVLDGKGATFPSLRREPSLSRALGDAILGRRLPQRPAAFSEVDLHPDSYREPHDVDWATGAAILIPAAVIREVGQWHDGFFMYSEETEYFRRIRESGRQIRFEPSAVVAHSGKGSGSSPALASLMTVNRVRYVERHHGRLYSGLFRATVVLAEALRSYDPTHRRNFATVMDRRRWRELPRVRKGRAKKGLLGPIRRGTIIVPAYNEAAVIRRTLMPLSRAAVEGFIELIVVCNGCSDNTAELARGVPGVRVLELAEGSKPAALNAGDEAATLWPRLYLDADIEISEDAVLAVLDRLAEGDVLAARPTAEYDFGDASWLVRSYYRARFRIPQYKLAMWGAGAYGLTAVGHARFGAFPRITGDDFFVDTQFGADEKVVVPTDPAMVKTPTDVKSLLAVRRRSHRGTTELSVGGPDNDTAKRNTSLSTVATVISTIRGLRSALDAAVYLGVALAARRRLGSAAVWERDDSSRSAV